MCRKMLWRQDEKIFEEPGFSPRQTAAKISLGYAAVGWLWILTSDSLVPKLTQDVEMMVLLNSIKGSLYVFVTSGLLFLLVNFYLKRILHIQQKNIRNAQYIKAIIDAMPDILFVIDRDGVFVDCQATRESELLMPREQFIGKSLEQVLPPPIAEQGNKLIPIVLRTGILQNFTYTLEVNGAPRHFEIRISKINDNEVVGITRDITERKLVEEALQESHKNLERKVEERTQELSAVNEELRSLNEEMAAMNEDLIHTNERLQTMQGHLVQSEKMAALGNLVAGVAHEINTPIGVSVTAASYLNNVSGQFMNACSQSAPDPKIMTEYLEDIGEATSIILKNIEKASRLIKSFKQVSVDQSSESRRSFEVKEYLEEVLLSLNPLLRNRNQTVSVECDPALKISSYPGALAQIVTNLLMNSLQHAYAPDDPGEIRIVAEKKENLLEIHYSDDGRGMEPAVLSRIFEPFFTTRRGSGGTGLGLYVVYNIINRQLKGSIDCKSKLGHGTEFTIQFPV